MVKTSLAMCTVAMALLTACGAPKPRSPHDLPAAAQVGTPTGRGVYKLDSAASELRLLIHRAGPAARLGHNHVIVNRAVGGWIRFLGDDSAASFFLDVPVAAFVVDDAAARGEEGADFSEEVSADAKAGTRRNMLGDALLDGDRFPSITLTSVSLTRTRGALTATMTVRVAGHDSTIAVPFMLDADANRIVASGTAVLRQSALGLTPFSVMLGALQVQDDFTVKFKLVARV